MHWVFLADKSSPKTLLVTMENEPEIASLIRSAFFPAHNRVKISCQYLLRILRQLVSIPGWPHYRQFPSRHTGRNWTQCPKYRQFRVPRHKVPGQRPTNPIRFQYSIQGKTREKRS